jgi:uncharacterized SAM-binding protein YcdF (DUF218 family)
LFLLVGVTIGVAILLTGRGRRTGAVAWLAGLAILYWVLSLPIVPSTMESWLGAGFAPLASPSEAGEARLVVVLTGGASTLHSEGGSIDVPSTASAYRMLEAERLYRLLDEPVLLLSGGPAGRDADGTPESESMKAELVARGIPEDKIRLDDESPDTHEQSVRIADQLKAEGIEDFVLVTSRAHMRRAMAAFAAQGLKPIPSVADPAPRKAASAPTMFLPSGKALGESEGIFRELFALIYYRTRGWLG